MVNGSPLLPTTAKAKEECLASPKELGGGCFFPAFANPVYQVAGSPLDFSVAPGFNPFPDLGTFPDGSVNTLNVGSDSAILAVEPGGTIQIQ